MANHQKVPGNDSKSFVLIFLMFSERKTAGYISISVPNESFVLWCLDPRKSSSGAAQGASASQDGLLAGNRASRRAAPELDFQGSRHDTTKLSFGTDIEIYPAVFLSENIKNINTNDLDSFPGTF